MYRHNHIYFHASASATVHRKIEIMYGMEEDFFESASSESMRIHTCSLFPVFIRNELWILLLRGKNERNNQLDSGWKM